MEVRRRVPGDEHMETRRALHDLAVLYVREGEYAKAERLYYKLLAVQTRLSGAEH
jgi:hypothetical protein